MRSQIFDPQYLSEINHGREVLYEMCGDSDNEDYVLERLEGLGYCYHPGRGRMTVMPYCVWESPRHKGRQCFQPLERVPPRALAEYMRDPTVAYIITAHVLAETDTRFV